MTAPRTASGPRTEGVPATTKLGGGVKRPGADRALHLTMRACWAARPAAAIIRQLGACIGIGGDVSAPKGPSPWPSRASQSCGCSSPPPRRGRIRAAWRRVLLPPCPGAMFHVKQHTRRRSRGTSGVAGRRSPWIQDVIARHAERGCQILGLPCQPGLRQRDDAGVCSPVAVDGFVAVPRHG